MAKKLSKCRAGAAKSKPFDRGCLLSGCLCYLGCASVLLIIASALSITFVAKLVAHFTPQIAEFASPVTFLCAASALPITGVVIGLVELLQIRAVWQGYRWGAYGLILIVLSQLVSAMWGTQSVLEALTGVLGTAYNNIPLIILFILLRPKWKAMQ